MAKNTSTENDVGITLIDDISEYKQGMLTKVRRGVREELQELFDRSLNLSAASSKGEASKVEEAEDSEAEQIPKPAKVASALPQSP